MLRHQLPPRVPPPRVSSATGSSAAVSSATGSSAAVSSAAVSSAAVPPLRVPPPRFLRRGLLRYGFLRRGLLRYGFLRYGLGPSHHVCHVLFTPIPRSLRAVTISVTKPHRNGSPRSIPPSIPTPSDGRSGPVQRAAPATRTFPDEATKQRSRTS